jgi:hypothetical protein
MPTGGALRDAQQREALQPGGVDHALQVAHLVVEVVAVDIPI